MYTTRTQHPCGVTMVLRLQVLGLYLTRHSLALAGATVTPVTRKARPGSCQRRNLKNRGRAPPAVLSAGGPSSGRPTKAGAT